MTNAWMVVAVLAATPTPAPASDPAAVQDPPGEVDVWQPAGVTIGERNTAADLTDTLTGGGQTEITRASDAQAGAVEMRAAEDRAAVAPGAEARTSSDAPSRDDAATGTAEPTSLGTDTGHGTGTEAAAPPASR